MKKIAFAPAPAVILLSLILLFQIQEKDQDQYKINPVIGDQSYIEKFGEEPDENSQEDLRIKTHLEYAMNLIRSSNTDLMSQDQINKRENLMTLLNEYILDGKFPVNYDHAGRRPCFIDMDGRICAVGYLIEKSAGRNVAEQINSKYKYEYIIDMKDPVVKAWIEKSGLTETECAMIQPTYEYGRKLSSETVMVSLGLTVANLTLDALNAVELSERKVGSVVPYVGLITGILQSVLGFSELPPKREFGYGYRYEERLDFALLNIGVGGSALILSVLNTIDDGDKKEKKAKMSFYGVPGKDKNFSMGINFKHTF